ncbi:MAG: TetR/AcrR family transcriptional regulator [Myxococcota bacterium]
MSSHPVSDRLADPAVSSDPSPPSDSAGDRRRTKERLLDAAERQFGERGFEGASMRAITRSAGTSVSAANYHFGSKESLLRAVIQRRLEPVNRHRLRSLEQVLGRADQEGRAVTVEEVLEAFLRPSFEYRATSDEARRAVRQVAARLFADPPELVAVLKRELFHDLVDRFLSALGRALPDQSRDDLALSFQFTVGLMVHVMAGHLDDAPALGEGDEGAGVALSEEEILVRMIAYAAAGLRSPQGVTR